MSSTTITSDPAADPAATVSPPPSAKKMKLDPADATAPSPHCQHFVTRKKRFCKMTVARGKTFCGEHLPDTIASSHEDSYIAADKKSHRVPCPLDPKHTVYVWKLAQHLKCCNAKAPPAQPDYIVKGLNLGAAVADDGTNEGVVPAKLSELPAAELDALIAQVHRLYDEHRIADAVTELHLDHPSMAAEMARDIYGPEALKHLRQTAAILGCLELFGLLPVPTASETDATATVAETPTSYVEFGAGKGHLSYWLAQLVQSAPGCNVILIDRASHRHKQDNKLAAPHLVRRIRADIADLRWRAVPQCAAAERLVGVSKHLCGAATDLAVRCMLADDEKTAAAAAATDGGSRTTVGGFVIALCCHHRCDWRPFVGKRFLAANGIGRREFAVLTKLVSWAVCGSGMSREARKAMEERAERVERGEGEEEGEHAVVEEVAEDATATTVRLTRVEREAIGRKCKRLLDFARVDFLRNECDMEASLHYYIGADVTLENVCIVGRRKTPTAEEK